MVEKEDKEMKTVIINHKMYEIQNVINCTNCIFYDKKNKPHCKQTVDVCINGGFIYVREIKFFERIKIWFKKKINK